MKKYTQDEIHAFREAFKGDMEWWGDKLEQRDLDIQCITTQSDDPAKPAGPWPLAEWRARHVKSEERPCLHEDILTPYCNQVINKIDLNPMGIETSPGEGASKETSERLENRIRAWEYEEKATQCYLPASKDAIEGSFGWWKVEACYAGKFNQKLKAVPIADPTTIVPSFFKRADASDMRRCWELERMSREEFKSKYPGKASTNFELWKEGAPDWINDQTVQVAALWHLDEDDRVLLDIDGPEGPLTAYADEFKDGTKALEGSIRERRKVKQAKVLKTIFNGIEALDETEWLDPGDPDYDIPPEIPIFGVFGRMKYEQGKLVIESLVRKGRAGQLRFDILISTIQEVTSMTGKPVWMGAEGQFDTTSDYNPRSITPYKEYKPVSDPQTNQPLPPPNFQTYEPPIQALELQKESVVRDVERVIGMASVEHKDRVAKSGKALDALMSEMSTGTSHYFNSLRIAQERQYRMLSRVLPVLEQKNRVVGLRDKLGDYRTEPLPENPYAGKHSIAVGVGKMYQTLQDKQEDAFEQLTQIKDPALQLAILPGAIRARDLGPEFDQIADMLEAMQPPQMQQARMAKQNGQPIDPRAMQAINQAKDVIAKLNAHSKQLEQQLIELQDEKRAKIIEKSFEKEMNEDNNRTKIEVAEIQTAAKTNAEVIANAAEQFRIAAEIMMHGRTLATQSQQQVTDQQFQADQAGQDREHEAAQAEQDRSHEAMQSDADRQQAAELAAQQQAADAEQAQGAEA